MSVSTLEWPENLVLCISTRGVSSRSVVRGCRPVPQNWVAGGEAGGFRVLVIVTAVCVVAAVDDSVDSTHRVSLELLSQDSMTVPAQLSLV